jgi:hypothetical protein
LVLKGSNLTLYREEVQKEVQNKPKASRKKEVVKIRVEINENRELKKK